MPDNEYYSMKNSLRRDGTSQNQRRMAALDPDFVKVDERTIQDFLVFARDFARQVFYFNNDGRIEGDWECFWAYDLSFIIAAIEKVNPYPGRQEFFRILDSNPAVEGLSQLFRRILDVAGKLDKWYQDLPAGNDFRDQISRLVRSKLNTSLVKLAGFEKGAYSVLGSKGYNEPDSVEYTLLSSLWNLGDYATIKPDKSLFRKTWEPAFSGELPANPDDDQKLANAYDNLKTIFTEVYNVYFQVIKLAATWFEKSLLLGNHEPHIALFISFLRLYQKVQDDLNKLTEKHLNFYYRDVLQLKLKPAVADKLHLWFTLAKHADEHLLVKGSRFLAGKDKTGADLFYELDKDIVLNRASVDSIRTVFVGRDGANIKKITAAPVANSKDGMGAPFTNEEKPSWKTLGSSEMPEAGIGFAIASNELLMAGGDRKITLTFTYPELVAFPEKEKIKSALSANLSGEKDWIVPTTLNVNQADATSLIIEIGLTPDKPAVVPFNEKALKEKLGTNLPVVKVMLDKQTEGDNKTGWILDFLKNITITSLKLHVLVTGASDIVAFNDLGAVDITKSFLPFGPAPVVGSAFYFGSKEAFRKSLQNITLNLTWENLPKSKNVNEGPSEILNLSRYYLGYDDKPAANSDFKFKAIIINSKGDSEFLDLQFFPNSNSPNQYVQLNYDESKDSTEIQFKDSTFWSNTIESNDLYKYGEKPYTGFIRLDLLRDFEHDQYAKILPIQTLAAGWLPLNRRLYGAHYTNDLLSDNDYIWGKTGLDSNLATFVIIPNKPYTPTIKTISLDYASEIELGVTASEDTFFIHLHPFNSCYQAFDKVNNLSLIPRLHINESKADTRDLQGSLLLGIKDLKPLQSLSILFTTAENTADPGTDEAIVHWQHLAGNGWKDFMDYEITGDTTKGLVTSGIITFTIPLPEAKETENTILPGNLYWLRAYVEMNSAAVSETINIHTQAVKITFQDNKNDPDHLDAPLPAKTIGKLEKDDPAIASVNQDYDSFGGRPAEKPLDFYTRVSERLHHKGRAISLYDYERIVLEEFPDIYKVKCINHTNEDDQLAPGHVLIAVIPDFSKMKGVDRKRPKVTRGRLEEIGKYLEARNSLFVGSFLKDNSVKKYLHVVNPFYKLLTVSFSVRFKPDITAVDFHIRMLKKAIIGFLSPWAYENGNEINFGGKVFKSSILDFVEELDYVDYVTNFRLMDPGSDNDVNFIESDKARTVLVPADEDQIIISPIPDANECAAENLITGDSLGYLTINDYEITK